MADEEIDWELAFNRVLKEFAETSTDLRHKINILTRTTEILAAGDVEKQNVAHGQAVAELG